MGPRGIGVRDFVKLRLWVQFPPSAPCFKRYRLYWPRRHGKQPDFWVWVVIEDVLSSYYGRWDAIVRPADPANGYGQARVWLSKLETGP